jgi:hypothetical protein
VVVEITEVEMEEDEYDFLLADLPDDQELDRVRKLKTTTTSRWMDVPTGE